MKKERIVVKIGSSSLTTPNGRLSGEKLKEHVSAIAGLRERGHQVILVSSGAVAAGFGQLGYPSRPVKLAGKQAAAAVGQGLLMEAYTKEFHAYGIPTGQLLLTRDNFSNRPQYQNAYNTLSELLQRQVLPIINENDSIVVDELTFGDNDMLSALVGGLCQADDLFILTDVDGLYDSHPKDNPDAKKYHFLSEITDELLIGAGGSGSLVGTGGMKSKLLAAQTALQLGLRIFIGTGSGPHKLTDIIDGKGNGTYIGYPGQFTLKSKQQWLALHSLPSGELVVDGGAKRALLQNGRSLLPAGIKLIKGTFSSGSVVQVVDEKGTLIGKGQVNMSSAELADIKGKSSTEAAAYTKTIKAEVIHRDDWVAMKEMK